MMINTFYVMLTALSFLRYLHFCHDVLVMKKIGLIRKLRLFLKFMTSQTGQRTITVHILSNVIKSKGKQTMKFPQPTEHNMRNVFLEMSTTKCGGEASPRPFFKKLKLSISLDQEFEMLYSLFLLYIQVEVYQNT